MGCAPSKDENKESIDSSRERANGTAVIKYFRAKPTKETSQIKIAAEEGKYSLMQGYESDPRCPLTERQLYSITKSWKAINREMSTTAINMFVRLFETNADIRYFFTKFKDISTVSELRQNKAFEMHALMVVSTIDEVIANLDDMDYVIDLLISIGKSHSVRFKEFKWENFMKIEEPFLMAVKETLGDRYTVSIENVYRFTIQYILRTLAEGFKNHRQAQPKDINEQKTVLPSNGTSNQTNTEVKDTDRNGMGAESKSDSHNAGNGDIKEVDNEQSEDASESQVDTGNTKSDISPTSILVEDAENSGIVPVCEGNKIVNGNHSATGNQDGTKC